RSVREVYDFHDATENLWLDLRDGEHIPEVKDIERFVDFFDTVFHRRDFPKVENFVHGYTFENWKKTTGTEIDPTSFPVRETPPIGSANLAAWKKTALDAIHWALGKPAPYLEPALATTFKENSPPKRNALELTFGRPQADEIWRKQLARHGIGSSGISFGHGLDADLFYPLDENGKRVSGKLPVVIWLHPYAHAVGWSAKRPWSPRQANFTLDQRPDFAAL